MRPSTTFDFPEPGPDAKAPRPSAAGCLWAREPGRWPVMLAMDMTVEPIEESGERRSDLESGPTAAEADEDRRPYASPQLTEISNIDELLEVLGPAQASYGGSGLP